MTDSAKILIADDEQECIDFVRDALADTPHEIIAAMDGEEALKMAKENSPQLIILDVQMPKATGFQVFEQLKADEKLSSVPVIMLTSTAERTGVKLNGKDMGQYMGAEPEAYIDKPIEPIVLKQTVARLLAAAK